jgi:hypothetical protein
VQLREVGCENKISKMFSKPITNMQAKEEAESNQRETETLDAAWCEMQTTTNATGGGKMDKNSKNVKGVIIASQNFNGFMIESNREVVSVQMKRMGIDRKGRNFLSF